MCNGTRDAWLLARPLIRWEEHPYGGAFAERAAGFDVSPVRFDEVFHDRQTQARAALLARAAGIGAVEPLENARQVLGADPGAGVGHRNDHAAGGVLHRDGDATAGWCVAEGGGGHGGGGGGGGGGVRGGRAPP